MKNPVVAAHPHASCPGPFFPFASQSLSKGVRRIPGFASSALCICLTRFPYPFPGNALQRTPTAKKDDNTNPSLHDANTVVEMVARGFLVPEHFKLDPASEDDMNIASIIWGLSLGVTVFNCAKAFRQSKSAIIRRKRLTIYVVMIWAEIISSFILGVMTWLYLREIIGPSFQFYFFISTINPAPPPQASAQNTNMPPSSRLLVHTGAMPHSDHHQPSRLADAGPFQRHQTEMALLPHPLRHQH